MRISREDLAQELAERMGDVVDLDTLVQHFIDDQYDYFKHVADESELRDDAIDLGFLDEDDELEIIR